MQNRRSFLTATSAALAAARLTGAAEPAAVMPLLKPRPLKPGDTVALITPATYVSNPDALLLAQRTVEFLGLKWKMGANVAKREGYLGGTVSERLADLHSAFADPGVAAVFSIRGGYGSAALLDGIDYALLRRNPKIFLGYSDITAMHLGIHKAAGLVNVPWADGARRLHRLHPRPLQARDLRPRAARHPRQSRRRPRSAAASSYPNAARGPRHREPSSVATSRSSARPSARRLRSRPPGRSSSSKTSARSPTPSTAC